MVINFPLLESTDSLDKVFVSTEIMHKYLYHDTVCK